MQMGKRVILNRFKTTNLSLKSRVLLKFSYKFLKIWVFAFHYSPDTELVYCNNGWSWGLTDLVSVRSYIRFDSFFRIIFRLIHTFELRTSDAEFSLWSRSNDKKRVIYDSCWIIKSFFFPLSSFLSISPCSYLSQ